MRSCRNLGFLALLSLGAGLVASPAQAAKFRRPFNQSIGVNYGFDNNGSASGCRDYGCGSVCYDGHSGTDFPLSLGTTVVAAANGRISATYNGCANYGGLGNTCGGRCGNYVRIDYNDGTSTIYCHLELNSISVSTGQQVSCGQAIARSASSGNSSGPHLHFGLSVGGGSRDPFAGSCSQSTSYWVSQGSYPHPIPSTECENVCDCSPGQTQSETCGNCGTRDRSCGSDCKWGGWSSCTGQGTCGAGSVESRDCCDCGSQSRRCSGQCEWEEWSDCGGPDPNGGQDECATNEPGICSEGRVRCVDGCEACVRLNDPVDELCDDIDNDCSGAIDDGFPQDMGDPLPELAARLVDHSAPQVLEADSVGWAWAVFRNEGRSTWEASELWLVPASVREGQASPLTDGENWPAFDVAAVLEQDVQPGETASFSWALRIPPESLGPIEERFQLASSRGPLVQCPTPQVDVRVIARAAAPVEAISSALEAESSPAAEESSGCGCRTQTAQSHASGWLSLLALAAIVTRRKRLR